MSQVVLIPGRPGHKALLWWFQGPSADLADYSFELDGSAHQPRVLCNVGQALAITNGHAATVAQRTFLAVTEHLGEGNDTPHRFQVLYRLNDRSNLAYSRTLPDSADGLNIVLASCFCRANSRLRATTPLPRPFKGLEKLPHVKMLCGDQIYLDLIPSGWWQRRDLEGPWGLYDAQWRDPDFVAWMACSGNLCMADDHEFWNNYPSQTRFGYLSFTVHEPPEGMGQKMGDAFLIYQAVLNVDPTALLRGDAIVRDHLHCFEFPGELAPPPLYERFAMHILDTRTRRSAPELGTQTGQFTDPQWLDETVARLARRQMPSLLVTSQSLLDKGDRSESNLANYTKQFTTLWKAIWNNRHQMLLLTGDIHWSRAQRFKSEATQKVHYEVVSSALARIGPGSLKRPGQNSEFILDTLKVSAERTADSYAKHTFATLSFNTTAMQLQTKVRWWEIDGDGQHVQIDMAAGLWAEIVSEFKAQKMEVNLGLS